jgi:hypothetical protein
MRLLAAVLPLVAVSCCLPLSSQQPAGSIDVPAGAATILAAKGQGVQIYSCMAEQHGARWVLTGPDAKLLDDNGEQIGTHFTGPTWKLNDGSQVSGELLASQPSPDTDSVAWLLLRAKAGSATGKLAAVAFIRRTETHGGVPAASDCHTAGDVGKTAQVPYSANYAFYAAR